MKTGYLIQEIPTTFPLSKRLPNSRMIALAQRRIYENLEICCLIFSSIMVVESTPLARNFRKSE
jgi:hypothetical protein